MTSQFDTSTSGHLHITLTGDLIGGADAMQFAVALRDSLASHTPIGRVDVNAADVGFVNSSGLGMLIAARQATLEHGGEFRLLQPSDQLNNLLHITKLMDLLGAG